VRFVADETGCLQRVTHVRFHFRHVRAFVAFAAELLRILDEQSLFGSPVRVMARRAIVHDGVFESGFFQEIVVAFEAIGFSGLGQQALVVRGVRRMARHAFAIFKGRMNNLGFRIGRIVAIGTQGGGRFAQEAGWLNCAVCGN